MAVERLVWILRILVALVAVLRIFVVRHMTSSAASLWPAVEVGGTAIILRKVGTVAIQTVLVVVRELVPHCLAVAAVPRQVVVLLEKLVGVPQVCGLDCLVAALRAALKRVVAGEEVGMEGAAVL